MTDPRPIVVISNIIIDDIVLADGARRSSVLGGAATYSAIGAASWWPQVAIVAGVGRDLDELTGGRLARLGLRDAGLLVRDPHTIRNHLVYLANGERTETPALGVEHFARMQTTPDDVPEGLLPAAGTYFFRDDSPRFWQCYARRRAQLGTTLWEWQAGAATPSAWPSVRAHLPTVDMFSLTLSEARDLLDLQSIRASLLRYAFVVRERNVLQQGGSTRERLAHPEDSARSRGGHESGPGEGHVRLGHRQ
jgi:sugar/nucleoside kinase (ribokinase family)